MASPSVGYAEEGIGVLEGLINPFGLDDFLLRTEARIEIDSEELEEEEAADPEDICRRGIEEAQVEHFATDVDGRGGPDAAVSSSRLFP